MRIHNNVVGQSVGPDTFLGRLKLPKGKNHDYLVITCVTSAQQGNWLTAGSQPDSHYSTKAILFTPKKKKKNVLEPLSDYPSSHHF